MWKLFLDGSLGALGYANLSKVPGTLLGGHSVLRPEPKRLGGYPDLPRAMPVLVRPSSAQCPVRLELEGVDPIVHSFCLCRTVSVSFTADDA